jgi:hypothetical protein
LGVSSRESGVPLLTEAKVSKRQRDIDWVFMDHADRGAVRIGDHVCVDAGGLPTYEVMSLSDGRAWLRDDRTGADLVAPLTRFLWKASPRSRA